MVVPVDRGHHRQDPVPQSFVIKIWIEETAEEAGQATWRSHITHVSSGRRRYIQDLGQISAFIVPYLEQMGVGLGGQSRP